MRCTGSYRALIERGALAMIGATSRPQEFLRLVRSSPPAGQPLARWLRASALVVSLTFIGWQVLQTEHKVARLRADGFEDFVIESTRIHAYAPLVMAMAGAMLSMALWRMVQHVLRQRGD